MRDWFALAYRERTLHGYRMHPPPDMLRYASGDLLRGDDFTPEQVREWFEQETRIEGYEEKVRAYDQPYVYTYHELNRRHAYRHLPEGMRFPRALGLGSYTGDEFMPISDRLDHITVLEPSSTVARETLNGVPARYIPPSADGSMPFPDGAFDLVTCFGTLHHIPNVGAVLRETYRVMKPGAIAIIREPAISMGDWTRPRPGLTRNERGIPLPWLTSMAGEIGFRMRHTSLCVFPGLGMAGKRLGFWAFNSPFWCALDHLLCRATGWNLRYWRGSFLHQLAPTCFCVLLEKPATP